MGLLKEEVTHTWEEILKEKDEIKMNGIKYFISIYHAASRNVPFYWGDEIEMMVCAKDGTYFLVPCNTEISKYHDKRTKYTVEFGSYMIESTPSAPYLGNLASFVNLETNIKQRINLQNRMINQIVKNSFTISLTCFPDLKRRTISKCSGCKNCTTELFLESTIKDNELTKSKTSSNVFDASTETIHHTPENCICKKSNCSCLQIILDRASKNESIFTKSKTFADNKITPHRRFFSFVDNIRNRRGKKIEGYIRIMEDKDTKFTEEKENKCILIDSMGQGMGCCCLQVTLQAKNYEEAIKFYDVFAVLSPLMLRITRATPFANGYLLNTETRWMMLSYSVDCRTDEERGNEYEISGNDSNEEDVLQDFGISPSFEEAKLENHNGVLKEKPTSIPKSRFSSVDLFLDPPSEKYNDIFVPTIPKFTELLLENKVDKYTAQHISSIFVRDPMLAYHNSSLQDDFENIQSSNWRSVRLKLPVFNEGEDLSGWKIEFRPMEIQMTAYENAFFTNFSVLLSKSIIFYGLNIYIPMSYVDKNFKKANIFAYKAEDYKSKLSNDPIKFYYRKNMFDNNEAYIGLDTLDVIFNGNSKFIGLMNFVRKYVDEFYGGSEVISRQLDFISKKFSGEYISTSDYLRKIVINHEEYKNDSLLNDGIIDFLIENAKEIGDKNEIDYLINK